MTRFRLFALFSVLALLAPERALGTQDLSPQDILDGLTSFLKDKDDAHAVGSIEILGERFSTFAEADQKKAVSLLDKALDQNRDEGDNALYLAVFKTLSQMGPMGEKTTLKNLKSKTVKDRPEVLAAAVESLGSHKNDKNIEVLIDYLVYKDAEVVASAARALGENYADQPEKVRKDIVEELVKNYSNCYTLTKANPKDFKFSDRLRAVEEPMKTSLQKLTGQSLSEALEWERWYNDNKKKPWGENPG